MSIETHPPAPDLLGEIVEAVAGWQRTGAPVQLHPGDLGWNWSLGTGELAAALRVWTRDGRIVAVGLLEGETGPIRMALDPAVGDDAGFAARLLADLTGIDSVEARFGPAFQALLVRHGWVADEPWSPLARDLTAPVEDCGLRVEVAGPQHVHDRVAVQRAAFDGSTFSLSRWQTMAAAPPYRRGCCLVGFDVDGNAVAAVTVWSAGEGRPGLLEPLGVHRDHRGRGYGRAISVAAAAALQRMGASSATVCTPSNNVGAVATYVSAGFRRLPEVSDLRRPGQR